MSSTRIAILPSQIPLPAPRGYASCGVAFCQFLWYPLSRKALSCKCSGHAPSLASHCAASGGSSIFCHPPDGFECTHTRFLKEEFHHGYFEYCFFRTEPFGYSHHRCHQCDMDDFEGCLSEQASGKALFQKTARKMTARCVQTSAVMFSSKM